MDCRLDYVSRSRCSLLLGHFLTQHFLKGQRFEVIVVMGRRAGHVDVALHHILRGCTAIIQVKRSGSSSSSSS